MSKILRLLPLVALLCTSSLVQAQNTLTVADGTEVNSYVPIYGLYCDAFLRSQTIYPSSMMAEADANQDFTGATINAMTFYINGIALGDWGAANFEVRLMEVDRTTLTDSVYVDTDNAPLVYSGPLDGQHVTMEVPFTTPYTYNGGNLLLEVKNTAKGNYKSATFLGQAAAGASCGGFSYFDVNECNYNIRDFIPKVTFSYAPGELPTAVNDVNTNDEIVSIYSLDGVQRQEMQQGINIVRYQSGKTAKILVK